MNNSPRRNRPIIINYAQRLAGTPPLAFNFAVNAVAEALDVYENGGFLNIAESTDPSDQYDVLENRLSVIQDSFQCLGGDPEFFHYFARGLKDTKFMDDYGDMFQSNPSGSYYFRTQVPPNSPTPELKNQ